MLNDYHFRDDPAKADDSRWVHRPITNWSKVDARKDRETVEGQIYQGMRHLIDLRKECSAFAGNRMDVIDVGNDHVFGFVRTALAERGERRVLVLANFTERMQPILANEIRLYGLGYKFSELISGEHWALSGQEVVLKPYQVVWLSAIA